jgi:hypothetical protein
MLDVHGTSEHAAFKAGDAVSVVGIVDVYALRGEVSGEVTRVPCGSESSAGSSSSRSQSSSSESMSAGTNRVCQDLIWFNMLSKDPREGSRSLSFVAAIVVDRRVLVAVIGAIEAVDQPLDLFPRRLPGLSKRSEESLGWNVSATVERRSVRRHSCAILRTKPESWSSSMFWARLVDVVPTRRRAACFPSVKTVILQNEKRNTFARRPSTLDPAENRRATIPREQSGFRMNSSTRSITGQASRRTSQAAKLSAGWSRSG